MNVNNFEEYQEFVWNLASEPSKENLNQQLATLALGLSGESAEVLGSSAYYFFDELSDILWYATFGTKVLNTSVEDLIRSYREKEFDFREFNFREYHYEVLKKEFTEGDFTAKVVKKIIIECGEVTDTIKKILFQGKEFSEEELKLKLVKVLYYLAVFDLENLMKINVLKLSNRYKSGKFNVKEFKEKENAKC